MKILALDPATNCGVAHTSGLLTTWRLASGGHPGQALEEMRHKIVRLHSRRPFDRIVCELAAMAAQQKGHDKTAARHSMFLGAIYEAAWQLGGLPVLTVSIMTLKSFAGHGRATKEDMIRWAKEKYGVVCNNDDEADARHLLAYGEAYFAGTLEDKFLPTGQRKKTKKKATKRRTRRTTTSCPKPAKAIKLTRAEAATLFGDQHPPSTPPQEEKPF